MSVILAVEVDIYSDHEGRTLLKESGKCQKIPALSTLSTEDVSTQPCVCLLLYLSVRIYIEVGVAFAVTLPCV